MYLLCNGKVITRDECNPYIENGGVLIDGTKIMDVGTTDELKSKYSDVEIVDAKGLVIMPSFINAHTHIYSGLARGLSINGYNPHNFEGDYMIKRVVVTRKK